MKARLSTLALLALCWAMTAVADTVAPPAGATLAAPKVPSAAEALAAWNEYRVEPLARLDKTPPFLNFIRDSGQVHIVLNNDLMAWMYQPMDNTVKAALYASFLGGNMAAQLAARQSGDNDDVAGMDAALDAYAAARKAHPDFQLPLFERLAKARGDNKLAEAVKDIESGAATQP
ncbi:MAG: hypothetical protein IPG43_05455 [Proteobacteria bacterium]|nr:hypothetical protein [Pseudomonadota bacterium]